MDTNVNEINRQVIFFRDHVMGKSSKEELPTEEDFDSFKLSALNDLLNKMAHFVEEMKSVGIEPKPEEGGKWKEVFSLTDDRYNDQCTFSISIKSKWFDDKLKLAVHAGFGFFLHIEQRVHPEISDWVNIKIKHVNVRPISLTSQRDYDRYLKSFYFGKKFFDEIDLGKKERHLFLRSGDMSLKSADFNKAASDACLIMDKLILTKEHLKEHVE